MNSISESDNLTTAIEQGERSRIKLSELLLDSRNPRFGGLSSSQLTQADVLDHIVENFGVDDILSSLSVNGYFEAEPVVAKKTEDGLIVAEGNRRLAACLMIAEDPRAIRQQDKARPYIEAWKAHQCPSIDPIPVIVFSEKTASRQLLSYLGVRHISASKSWDSFAKAAWVADVVDQHAIPVADIAKMIGDQHRTIERLLQGYYLAKQLIDTGNFRPSDSQRSGRGSVTEYPFSWVYTILGYAATQRYLGLQPGTAKPDPLEQQNLGKGAVLMRAMFGDKKTGRSSSVVDSRQLGRLASLLVNPETLTMVEQGKSVDEIESATQHIDEKLRQGIEQVRATLRELVSRMDEVEIDPLVAFSLIEPSEKASNLAINLSRKLRAAAIPNAGTSEDL